MTLLEVHNLTKVYKYRHSLFQKAQEVTVLNNIEFSLQKGECVGIVGKSGSGKSTLSRIILGLEKPTAGNVYFNGLPVERNNSQRKDLQAVFQNSLYSFNPTFTVAEIIEEPLLNFENFTQHERRNKVYELLECVELTKEIAAQYPSQLSGGQQQRVNIARAIALNPKCIILDEAISSLDMVLQKHILELLQKLKQQFELSYIFISHDLNVTRYICDRVLVIEEGCLVEELYKESSLKHAASKELYEAMLPIHPRERKFF